MEVKNAINEWFYCWEQAEINGSISDTETEDGELKSGMFAVELTGYPVFKFDYSKMNASDSQGYFTVNLNREDQSATLHLEKLLVISFCNI